jgi:hypothetical protein
LTHPSLLAAARSALQGRAWGRAQLRAALQTLDLDLGDVERTRLELSAFEVDEPQSESHDHVGDPILPPDSWNLVVAGVVVAIEDPEDLSWALAVLLLQLEAIRNFSPVARSLQQHFAGLGGLPVPDVPSGPDDGPGTPPLLPPSWEVDWRLAPRDRGWRSDVRPGRPGPTIAPYYPCLRRLLSLLRQTRRAYLVSRLSPPYPCPGEVLAIEGLGFGSSPGKVRFSAHPLGDLEVSASVWTDTRVEVSVPPNAVSGPLELVILDGIVEACGRKYPVYRQPVHDVRFEGGQSLVTLLRTNCTFPWGGPPGSVAWLEWRASNTARVELKMQITGGGIVYHQGQAPPSGLVQVTLPDVSVTSEVVVSATAYGRCGTHTQTATLTVQRPFKLKIEGVEITQAIQHYRSSKHLTSAEHQLADNALELCAGKTTVFRVYLRSGQHVSFDYGRLDRVRGTLELQRLTAGGWSTVGTYPSVGGVGGTFTATPGFASHHEERFRNWNSLLIRVPGTAIRGNMRAIISLDSVEALSGGKAAESIYFTAPRERTLRVLAVLMGYDGPDLNDVALAAPLPAPDFIAVFSELNSALLMWPVGDHPEVRFTTAPAASRPLKKDNAPGRCPSGWNPILAEVERAKNMDGNRPGWLVHGFLPGALPSQSSAGCTGSTLVGRTATTFAHEAGHTMGLEHAPFGPVGDINPRYPTYLPYDGTVPNTTVEGHKDYQDGSIGEYGFDVANLTVFSPRPFAPERTKDLMAYSPSNWISPYTWTYLAARNEIHSNAVDSLGSTAHALWGDHDGPAPRLTLFGETREDGRVDVLWVSRLLGWPPPVMGPASDIVCEVLDEKGRSMASAPAWWLGARAGCDCNGSRDPLERGSATGPWMVSMPDPGPATELRIVVGGRVSWKRTRPPEPEVAALRVQADPRQPLLRATWRARTAGASQLETALRWRVDGEDLWSVLAIGLRGREAVVHEPPTQADRILVEAVVQDGFHTIHSAAATVRLPPRRGRRAILSPRQGETLSRGSVNLRACDVAPARGRPMGEPIWKLDGREVARGYFAWLPEVLPGRHRLELAGDGMVAVRQEVVVVKPP